MVTINKAAKHCGMIDISGLAIDHALALQWQDLEQPSQRALLNFLHDSLAVGVAGRNGANAAAMMQLARNWGEHGCAPVLGRKDVHLPPAGAAFLNAFQIHCQEFDCVHEPAVLHPMATILSACLAELAQGEPVNGDDFLSGLAAGIDIAVALGLAAGPLSFFRPATAGIFGSVMAIARMRGESPQIARDALGHALSFASGTMQPHVEGKPALPIQVGNAARGAICAIDLARLGIAGVSQPLEGPFGYFALLETGARPDEFAAALQVPGQHVAGVSWKPFPTGRAAQGGIVAVRELMRDHGLTAQNLTSLTYHAPSLIKRLVGRPAVPDMAPGYARLCLAWLTGVTLTHGTVQLDHFEPAMLHDPHLLKLAAKVSVVADDNPDPAAFVPARACAQLDDGRQIEVLVKAQLGAPDFPLTRQQHLAKANDCLRFGGLAQCAAVLESTVANIADERDVATALESSGIFG